MCDGARAALSSSAENSRPSVTPCHNWPQTREPREDISRGSPLTGRLRSSVAFEEARQVGLEPTTSRLTAGCSTIELLPKLFRDQTTAGREVIGASGSSYHRMPPGGRRSVNVSAA
jgi:hypothetical protein